MSDSSTIPTPATPDVCSIAVLVGGSEVSGEFHVLSASVSNELNRVPSASLQFRDGEASRQTFPVSDTDHFVPGKEIEIRLGYRGTVETVFKGIIVKQRVRVRKTGNLLSVECRDKAVRMTTAAKSRYYDDATDSDILDELIGSYGLDRDVATTKAAQSEIVQFNATDWDFMVCRAEANGQVVAVRDGKVTVAPPDVHAQPVVTAAFGATVLELDAEIDARWQAKGITAHAWSPSDQALATADAAEPAVTASGDLSADDLADVLGGDPHVYRHGGKLSEVELQAWADASLLKDRLAKVRGRVRIQGFGGVTAGKVVEVKGIGARFAGPQYVAGVRHTFANGNWETDVAFGLDPEAFAASQTVTARAAGALLPAVHGLQIGIVTALVDDPEGESRIRVRLPLVSATEEGTWARLATLDAGSGRGTFFRPEIDDEVIVGFLDDDPRHPVVLGMCHSSAKAPPEAVTKENHVKGYVSRSKIRLTFDDDKKAVVVETPAGNKVTLSDDASAISIVDQHGSTLTLDDAGITLKSAKDLILSATGDVKVEGTNVGVESRGTAALKGQGGVEVSSSGATTVKGSVVRIN